MRSQGSTALKPVYDPNAEEEYELAPAPIMELVIPLDERASILTLDETKCRWPIGDPGDEDFHFCGRHSDAGVPYCEHHSSIAYQPAQSRRRGGRTASR
jgi:GcrA cell cycle regulator